MISKCDLNHVMLLPNARLSLSCAVMDKES